MTILTASLRDSGHTRGPWRVGPSHVVRHEWRDEQNRRCTGWIAECIGTHPSGELEANARLIAAAPDGHKIIEQLEESFTADGTYQQFLPAMRAYLAKAKGSDQ